MHIANVLQYMYQDADTLHDWEVVNDGEKTFISHWNRKESCPTLSEMEVVSKSDGFVQWMIDRNSQAIDSITGNSISKQVHHRCGGHETAGILREQIVQILNALGLEPTTGFASLNEIAIAEIEKAQIEKEAL